MEIIIWSFFAILIGQASCFPGFDFGFSGSNNDEVIPDQFLEDLKKLASDGGLSSEDEDAMKNMLNGIFDSDSSQQPALQQTEMAVEPPSPLPSNPSRPEPSQFLSSNPSRYPSLRRFSLSQVSNQYNGDSSMVEIKSLAEWVSLDRLDMKNGRHRQTKNPQSEDPIEEAPGAIQQVPSSLQTGVKNDEDLKNQSNETNLNKPSDQPQYPELIHQSSESQFIENNPTIQSNQSENPSISGEHENEPQFKNISELVSASQDEIRRPGYYTNSVDWMKSQTDPKIISPPENVFEEKDEEDDSDANSSFVDNLWSHISGFFPSF